MELEYKFILPDPEAGKEIVHDAALLSQLSSPSTTQMKSIYYDTPDQMLFQMRGGLRCRSENDVGVVCLKLTAFEKNGLFRREEYECPAHDILHGLSLLPDCGAPRELCNLLTAKGLSPISEIAFTRTAYAYKEDTLSFEICFDAGIFISKNKNKPFYELEMELLEGDPEKFTNIVSQLQKRYLLVPGLKSKLQRAQEFINETRGDSNG
ncbi:MAG: CYTH domain-containing protein [Clostridiales bacterium]|nr:CYTH domain-containing protein [Clostridiales bacterium]